MGDAALNSTEACSCPRVGKAAAPPTGPAVLEELTCSTRGEPRGNEPCYENGRCLPAVRGGAGTGHGTPERTRPRSPHSPPLPSGNPRPCAHRASAAGLAARVLQVDGHGRAPSSRTVPSRAQHIPDCPCGSPEHRTPLFSSQSHCMCQTDKIQNSCVNELTQGRHLSPTTLQLKGTLGWGCPSRPHQQSPQPTQWLAHPRQGPGGAQVGSNRQ